MSIAIQPCPQHGWMDAGDCSYCQTIARLANLAPHEDHRDKPYAKGLEVVTISKEEFDKMKAELDSARAARAPAPPAPNPSPAPAGGV